jgi:hypothetical protein
MGYLPKESNFQLSFETCNSMLYDLHGLSVVTNAGMMSN